MLECFREGEPYLILGQQPTADDFFTIPDCQVHQYGVDCRDQLYRYVPYRQPDVYNEIFRLELLQEGEVVERLQDVDKVAISGRRVARYSSETATFEILDLDNREVIKTTEQSTNGWSPTLDYNLHYGGVTNLATGVVHPVNWEWSPDLVWSTNGQCYQTYCTLHNCGDLTTHEGPFVELLTNTVALCRSPDGLVTRRFQDLDQVPISDLDFEVSKVVRDR